ncbi:MAG: aspartate aminotransferase family protein [Chlorobi bacterium]|nr:aspartate aminotransferase family protein [Chlorobiota bacterium]
MDAYFRFLARTGPSPLGIEPARAEGSYIYDQEGKKYLDLVAGVSALPLGHRHPRLVEALRRQSERYWHVMVYGEFLQDATLDLARELASVLPPSLQTLYPVNSGTEATEAALKLAKRATGRMKIVAARGAYHGNTQGSMSVMGYEPRKRPYVPLIPGVEFIRFNSFDDLEKIDTQTAAVILETIQGGAGFIEPRPDYLPAVKRRCEETGALLILDEIQTGYGRTGKMFGFEHYGAVPDILVGGKALGGGFPIGALNASPELMRHFTRPPLGHITTFGGHPVVNAVAAETLRVIKEENLAARAAELEAYIRTRLVHPLIEEIRGKGLMLALIMRDASLAERLVREALREGVLLFWLLYEPRAVRLTPPLTITREELDQGLEVILGLLNKWV